VTILDTAAPSVARPADRPASLSRVAVVAITAYAGAQVIAQITSLKIGVVWSQAVDMGTFIYPITFTLRDVVHKVAGRSAARTLILACAGVNLFLAAYLGWTASVPSDPTWGLGDEYQALLGPIWRIVLASLLAMVISELIDTEVYHFVVTRITRRYQWLRVLASNAVSVPVDNLVFALGAFAPIAVLGTDGLPWATVWSIFWVNLWVKGLVSVVSIPLIYVAKDRDEGRA
jgi:queuosine precursor transporter